MNQDGGGKRREGRGRGQEEEEGIAVDEVIHDLELGQMKKKIGKQFSWKQKALGELQGKFKRHSKEKMELKPMSSTEQVLKMTQFYSSNEDHI